VYSRISAESSSKSKKIRSYAPSTTLQLTQLLLPEVTEAEQHRVFLENMCKTYPNNILLQCTIPLVVCAASCPLCECEAHTQGSADHISNMQLLGTASTATSKLVSVKRRQLQIARCACSCRHIHIASAKPQQS
jgi:hypothetical protein